MPIKSYLAIPKEGQKEILQQQLAQIAACEVTIAENKNVLVLLTETANEDDDKFLFNQINNLQSLQLLTLVSAFSNQTESTSK